MTQLKKWAYEGKIENLRQLYNAFFVIYNLKTFIKQSDLYLGSP